MSRTVFSALLPLIALASCGPPNGSGTGSDEPGDTADPVEDTDRAPDDSGDTDEAGDTDVDWEAQFTVLSSSEPRADASGVTDPRVSALTSGALDLSVDLSGWLRDDDPRVNQFFSAHSVSLALSMLREGARGVTADEMDHALRFPELPPGLHEVHNRLDQMLAMRGEVPVESGDPPTLRIVNALWGAPNYPWADGFLDTLAMHYGAGMHVLDFAADPERARGVINGWIGQITEKLIPNLIPEGVLNADTRLVLTNAIYFKGSWAAPFSPSQTADATFHNLDGTTSTVPMMHQAEAAFPYAKVGDVEIIELPYVGGEVSMVLVVPPQGELGTLEAGLTGAQIEGWLDALEPESGTLRMPRFEVDARLPLKSALQDLGMEAAFNEGLADFSGITAAERLFITDALHQGVLKVDEEGTEAAAATAVVTGPTSVPETTFDLTVDRPFLLMIRDRPTGAPLFFGRVVGL